MAQRVSKTQIARATSVNTFQYINSCLPGDLYHIGGGEYRSKLHSSLTINEKGLFHWWKGPGVVINGKSRNGGVNAVDYLVIVEGYDFVSAVRMLNGYEPPVISCQKVQPASSPAPVYREADASTFQLPPPDQDNDTVIAYLRKRGIDPVVIRQCIENGSIYQTDWQNYKNCVFVGFDEAGKPQAAFRRSCVANWKRDVLGSKKKYGFLLPSINKACESVEVYEAPIDALSGATFRRFLQGAQWRTVDYLAMGGVAPSALEHYLEQHPQIKNIRLCTDSDHAGRDFVQKMKPLLEARGYHVVDAPPRYGKDYNEALLLYQQRHPKRERVR